MKQAWQTRILGDVCTIASPLVDPRLKQFSEMLHVGGANIESETGELRALRTAKEEGLKSGKFVFDETMVLYSKIRPYLMKVARPHFRGLCSADIYPLSPSPAVLDRGYLFYQLLSPHFTEFAVSGSARTGMPKVNRDHLFTFQFAVPPLAEQRRIVGLLDEAFAGLATAKANAEKNLQNARALSETYFESMVAQRGKGWMDRTLGEVAESIATGPFGSMLHKSDYVPSGVPLVNPMNIVDSTIVPSSRMMVSSRTRERLRAHVLKLGDVVVARRGELGRCALVTDREAGWLCGTGSFVVRLTNTLDSGFLAALLRSRRVRARLQAASVGATMSSLNHGILGELVLPIPPIADQRRILKKAGEVDEKARLLAGTYERKLSALGALKKSLLHQAFSGGLH